MAPLTPPRSAASAAGSTHAHKHTYQSPPPKQPQHGDTPPVPAPPPPPQIVPGPNAFAQHLRAIGTSDRIPSNESNPGSTNSPKQQYTVNTYRDLDPNVGSPTFARRGSRLYRMHHRQASSTDRTQTVLGSASSGSAPWSGYQSSFDSPMPYKNAQPAGSRFFEQMKQTRERLDMTIEESPQREEDAERLKLVPSPDAHSYPSPTHRAELDKKNVDRFRDLIANDGLISPNTQIANIHSRPSHLVTQKEGKTSSSTSTPKSQRSPKRGILNKLGLGLRITPPDENFQRSADYALLSSVPPKAAKVLGAKSLPTRDRHAAATSRPHEWPSPEGVSRSPSAPSPKRSSKRGDKAQPSLQQTAEEEPVPTFAPVPTKSPLRRESRRVPRKHQELRYYDDENPPTPPSKPRPSNTNEKQAEAGQQEPLKDTETEDQEPIIRRAANLQASPTPVSALYTRSGFAGYHSAAVPTTNTPSSNIASVYGSVAGSPAPKNSPGIDQQSLSPHQRHSYPDHSPSIKARTSKRASTTFLQPMKYDPKSPVAKAKWSVSHLPSTPASTTSRNSLKPGPLRLQAVAARRQRSSLQGQQKLQAQSSSNGSSEKSRDVSESTSASVPLFFETPDLSTSVEGEGAGEATVTISPTTKQVELSDSPGGTAADDRAEEVEQGDGEGELYEADEEDPNIITTEILREYLVETWSQGETIKSTLQSQADALDDLHEIITAGDNELVEEVEQLLRPIQQDMESTSKGIVAVKRAQDEAATAQAQQHAAMGAELTASKSQLSALTTEIGTLRSTIDALSSYLHTHIPLPPIPTTDISTTHSHTHTSDTATTPHLSITPITHDTPSSTSASDFALMSSSQRSSTGSPPRIEAPPKGYPQTQVQTHAQAQARTYPAFERTPSPLKIASAKPWASKRTRGQGVGGNNGGWSNEMGMRVVREGTTVAGQVGKRGRRGQEEVASSAGQKESTSTVSQEEGVSRATIRPSGGEGANVQSAKKEAAIALSPDREAVTVPAAMKEGASGDHGRISAGGRSVDMRNYLQSVPQSAQTDPGIRGGTWGRKVAREKFERWTG